MHEQESFERHFIRGWKMLKHICSDNHTDKKKKSTFYNFVVKNIDRLLDSEK